MSENIYETFRDSIRAVCYNTVVKVRDTSTSFTWSLGKVISACAEACQLPIKDTPEDFKRIVRFEFAKLKEQVATNDSWTLERSRRDFVLRDGEIKGRLANIYSQYITLQEQLDEATKIFSRLGKKLTDDTLSAEKRKATNRAMKRYLVVIDHCRAELERQDALRKQVEKQLEAEKQGSLNPESANTEVKS